LGAQARPKQAEASRAKGSKSKGPKSVAGKSKVAQNATRDGLFSRQVVIEQLGEKEADFENVKRRMRDVLQPTNAVEEMLVQDFIENWWGRERIRSAEATELRTRARGCSVGERSLVTRVSRSSDVASFYYAESMPRRFDPKRLLIRSTL
jgi:hypothetical protein